MHADEYRAAITKKNKIVAILGDERMRDWIDRFWLVCGEHRPVKKHSRRDSEKDATLHDQPSGCTCAAIVSLPEADCKAIPGKLSAFRPDTDESWLAKDPHTQLASQLPIDSSGRFLQS